MLWIKYSFPDGVSFCLNCSTIYLVLSTAEVANEYLIYFHFWIGWIVLDSLYKILLPNSFTNWRGYSLHYLLLWRPLAFYLIFLECCFVMWTPTALYNLSYLAIHASDQLYLSIMVFVNYYGLSSIHGR